MSRLLQEEFGDGDDYYEEEQEDELMPRPSKTFGLMDVVRGGAHSRAAGLRALLRLAEPRTDTLSR
jgi:hypothetical protein